MAIYEVPLWITVEADTFDEAFADVRTNYAVINGEKEEIEFTIGEEMTEFESEEDDE